MLNMCAFKIYKTMTPKYKLLWFISKTYTSWVEIRWQGNKTSRVESNHIFSSRSPTPFKILCNKPHTTKKHNFWINITWLKSKLCWYLLKSGNLILCFDCWYDITGPVFFGNKLRKEFERTSNVALFVSACIKLCNQ